MSGISSGIGLISGIDRGQLIDQLIAIESRPVALLQNRVRVLDAQRTALLDVSAKLLGAQNAAARFTRLSLFRKFNLASSNEQSLTATASENAAAGTHSFRVRSTATHHAVISRGFSDADRSGIGTGTLTFERAAARVNRTTELNTLNGGVGIRRGVITITDRSGARADVDLTAAVTLDDVLDAINGATGIRVRARVTGLDDNSGSGDRIVLEDQTNLQVSNLIIADRPGGFAALDLGISADVAATRVDGRDLVRLSADTPLSVLQDGNGVDRSAAASGEDLVFQTSYGTFSVSLADALRPETNLRALNNGAGVRLGVIRIHDRTGRSADVDLSQTVTVQDVREAIEGSGLSISVSIVNSNLQVRDTSEIAEAAKKNLSIEDLSGFSAADLGIAGNLAADTLTGHSVYRVETVGDVLRAINFAPGNASFVEATLSTDGKGIRLTALGFDNQVSVSGGAGSTAARDLGLLNATFDASSAFESDRLVAGLNTVLLRSLRGGSGVRVGTVQFTDAAGTTTAIDFAGVKTLQDVIDRVNTQPSLALRAAVNRAGTGLVLESTAAGGGGAILIEDISGHLAEDLGIVASADSPPRRAIDGGNLQLQYISRRTLLSDFHPAAERFSGEFRITDASGAAHIVSIASNLTNVGEVIDAINLRTPDTIEARINDTGDGIVLLDRSVGSGTLTIVDINGGRAAANLRLAGTARTGESFVNGTAEFRVSVNASDTLRTLAAKLNAAGGGFSASVLNEGRGPTPFSLTLTSANSGRAGELIIETGATGLHLETLVRPQDAVLTLGGANSSGSRVITHSSNSLDHVVEGVTLQVHAPGAEDVTLDISQDVDAVVEAVRDFVDRYNEVQADLDDKTSFDQDSLERGPLLGDPTVNRIRSRLHNAILQPFRDGAATTFLVSIGLRRGANNRLELDEQKFREAYTASPQSVERLFTESESGLGKVLGQSLEALTKEFEGVLPRRDEVLADQQEILNDRIADLNQLLAAKRARLEAQFSALETVLAGLQQQQGALAGLTRLATTAPS